MAKVKGPILSISARGQIGKSQVYADWRGVLYARQHVIPANPNTLAQQETRDTLRFLMDLWKVAPAVMQGAYTEAARGRPLTNRNQLVRTNLSAMLNQADAQDFLASPGANGGVPLANMTAAATAIPGEINVVFTLGTLPTGWTTTRTAVVAFRDQDPQSPWAGVFVTDTNAVAPYTPILLTGATSAVLYVVSGWWEMAKADGSFAASVARTVTATPL